MIKMAFNLFYIVLLMLLFLGVIMGMCVTKNEHLLLHWGGGGNHHKPAYSLVLLYSDKYICIQQRQCED